MIPDGAFTVSKSPVEATPDFRRIMALPRRKPPTATDSLIESVSAAWRMPGTRSKLLPVQAATLAELASRRGFFGPITVGGGKTLVTFLAPRVLGAKRPLLLVPGALLGADMEHKLRSYGKEWQIARNLRIASYDALSRVGGEGVLHGVDLIIADEGHRLKNVKASCTRKVAHYMAEHPETMFVALSGTFLSHSLVRDCSHIAMWCLKEGSPFPLAKGDTYEWAEALDEKALGFRRAPGVLMQLGPEGNVRERFQSRLVETEGVIVAGGDDVGASLRVTAVPYQVSSRTSGHFERLRTLAERPDGFALTEKVRVWAHARELALGFHSEWDPPAPQGWLDARKAWASYARKILGRNTPGLDSELAVVNWVDARGGCDELTAWRAIKPTFTVTPRDVWHDDTALELCAKWGAKSPGIIWVEHVFFGRALARRTGWPYFGAGGLDPVTGKSIADSRDKTIIASVDANRTGRNLQDRWFRNLVTSPEGLAKDWEQMIGRTHRTGQDADEVTFDVLLGCAEHDDAFKKALAGSQAEKEILGRTPKLLLSDVIWPDTLPSHGGWQWCQE